MTPKHLASKQWADVRVRLAARLLYCFGCGMSWVDVDVDFAAGRLVGHTAGHVEMCSCSPWAMRLYLAAVPCQRFSVINQGGYQPDLLRTCNHTNIATIQPNPNKKYQHTNLEDSYSPHNSAILPSPPYSPHQQPSIPSHPH